MRQALSLAALRELYDSAASRYDLQHALLTARSDQRGREALVREAVNAGDRVLDCGAGTGSTGVLAARRSGPEGEVILLDLSPGMLAVAREKMAASAPGDVGFAIGDLHALPFRNGTFDVVLSTYSLCPVSDPREGASELYRVTRPGGRVGIAHSTDATGTISRRLARGIERLVWRLPWISLGCRPVSVLARLQELGGRVLLERRIGVPLWPFLVAVVEKPASS